MDTHLQWICSVCRGEKLIERAMEAHFELIDDELAACSNVGI